MRALALLVAVFAASALAGPVPIVFWHGMGDSCCNPLSLGKIVKQVESEVPGIYAKSIQIGDGIVEDTLNGFFKNVNDQIDIVCKNLTADSNLKDGFNVIGFSQGGQFWRAIVQRCKTVKVFNLISVGGQHQGVFGFPRCPGNNSEICETVRKLLNLGAYVKPVQDILVQAEYWQDPLNLEEYREKSVFLADINQEREFNQDYKDRLSAISNFVMVKFLADTMVQPKDSEWFGFYDNGQDKTVHSLFESKIWKEDLLGLQHLNSTGRIHFIKAPGDHLQFSLEWFDANIMPYIKVDRSQVTLPLKVK